MLEKFREMCTMELEAYQEYYYDRLMLIEMTDHTGRGTQRINEYLTAISMVLNERRNNDRD